MTEFTPAAGMLGGALIGLSAALLMLLVGRIAGISGILSGVLSLRGADSGWRIAFLLGLLAAPVFYAISGHPIADPPMPGWLTVVAAGLLTGFGTRLGGGCTSGHGVCGNARLSPRSIAATVTFTLAGFLVVFIVRHALGVSL